MKTLVNMSFIHFIPVKKNKRLKTHKPRTRQSGKMFLLFVLCWSVSIFGNREVSAQVLGDPTQRASSPAANRVWQILKIIAIRGIFQRPGKRKTPWLAP